MAHDYLIMGAGPAGLQLAAHLEHGGHDYVVLERGSGPGTFFTRFPRHRQLISSNKVNTGYEDPELRLRMDWNSLLSEDPDLLFTRYSKRYFPQADDFVRYLADYAKATGIRVEYDTDITRVSRDDNGFTATDHSGRSWTGRRIVVATGVSQLHVPPIPGIEHAERYDTVTVDPDDFTGQRVLILGRGNSGFETADNLLETAAVIHMVGSGSLRMAWRTHYVGHLRAVNNNFLDTYQLKSQNAILDGRVTGIRRDTDGYHVSVAFERVDEVVKEIRYDRVIACTGFRFDASVFDDTCRPKLVINDRFPEQTPAYESTTVPGMYFAGTLTQQRDFKKSTNGFIHGYRYGVRALHRVLDQRHHDNPWPTKELAADVETAVAEIIRRANTTSALWQQFGVLADVLLVGADGTTRYTEEVPVDLLRDAVPRGDFGPVEAHAVITLEYGADHDAVDPFDVTAGRKAQDDAGGLDGRYLHPVVRWYRGGDLVAEHHLAENLENEWDSEDVHRIPLRAFLEAQLNEPVPTLP